MQDRLFSRSLFSRSCSKLLADLDLCGNPGLERRRVVGASRRSRFSGLFGYDKRYEVLVELEPAWPIGAFTWRRPISHGEQAFPRLATGYTPTGLLVPMEEACRGEPVDEPYGRLSIPGKEAMGKADIHRVRTADIVEALERALGMHSSRPDGLPVDGSP